MTEQHEWEVAFNPDNSFRRVKCRYCPEQMGDAEIEARLNECETLKAALSVAMSENQRLTKIIEGCEAKEK